MMRQYAEMMGQYAGNSAMASMLAAQQAATQRHLLASQALMSPYHSGLAMQNAYQPPERRNANGQTRREWLAGFQARIGMVEAAGIPMSEREERGWRAEAAEWL